MTKSTLQYHLLV